MVQHFILTTIPLPQEVFPPQILVRGHGPVGPLHPPLPWPREAAAQPTRRHSKLRNAAVFCLGSRGPEAQAPQAEPNRTEGRKTLRKFWRLKSESFGNCCHANSSLDFRNIVVSRFFEGVIELVKNNMLPLIFY